MSDSGVIILSKPPGMTSRKALNFIQRLAKPAKVGHAGTLDPLAVGVLVVCVGSATRLIEYVQRMPKTYKATFLLGRTSDTEDTQGHVEILPDAREPGLEELAEGASKLTGRIMQRPPVYSAIKVHGKRAYDLARRGKDVELKARPIDVYRFEVLRYDYPEVEALIQCGSGGYVRSLGRDMAESLGTGAVMSALTRSAIGDYRIEEAANPDDLTPDNWRERLLPSLGAVAAIPSIALQAEEIARLQLGQFIEGESIERITKQLEKREGGSPNEEWAAVAPNGRLAAIVQLRPDGRFGAKRNFPTES
jgi:tRNA pseudouridine55 synthase